jgi:hypothetical protein
VSVSDAARRELYEAFVENLGRGPADTVMELLPPVGWGDVARQSDLVALKADIGAVRAEIVAVRAEFTGKLDRQFGRLVLANIGSMIGLSALVLAAARL